ncbi:hypothetical protein HELRODRAFT_117052 [Helobdella robusta]|uniref:RING-type E3 ubiquitin transferase n=1 Tax=Helobdella robusta TaxID=6412 RepID=T1EGJ7_HELRO|nr:hypothetical protein HELRODRAFT_117052 [Helobdella robusta]ESO09821.1 hypothetical protein HELRODRAFT_117052 [Helobdella robusta]
MEEELKCPNCLRIITNPVLLTTCQHCVCLDCATRLQMPLPMPLVSTPSLLTSKTLNDSGIIVGGYETGSIFSETDSGVVCSRPDSYIAIGNGATAQVAITCPLCFNVTYSDDKGALSLPRAKTLLAISTRYRENKQLRVACQICNGSSSSQHLKPASKMCKECETFYCDDCCKIYHTMEKHELMAADEAREYLLRRECLCSDHAGEQASMYCVPCRVCVCELCRQQNHLQHQLQPLLQASKSHKAELSQMLHSLSEKAKSGTEFIARLKGLQEKVEETSSDFEQTVLRQCDQLIEAIKQHKRKLLSTIQSEKSQKLQTFKNQMVQCSGKVQKTTGLLQFSIEVLKENDPVSFLQISSSLLNKVSEVDANFVKEVEFEPRETAEFEYRIDSSRVLRAIESLELVQMKAPGVPQILLGECSGESNTITIVWQANQIRGGHPDGYNLEIDDGNSGAFRKVFAGKETICTIEGLHFDTPYRARVKAFNVAGDSGYSQCITLRTSRVAWFTFDACHTSGDVQLTNNNMTASCSSFEDRVVLGSVGFVRGVHFWEYVVDRYENNKDPAFGVARYDVDKHKMLGKDDKGWSTYLDNNRSWFIHNGQHVGRTHGGIGVGSVLGVLLDLDQQHLSFFLNGERHGPIMAFTGLTGVFYPAMSINRNVQITLNSGLEPPLVNLVSPSNLAPSTNNNNNNSSSGFAMQTAAGCNNFQLRGVDCSDKSIAA